jgi:hypothetical protein
MRVVRGEPAYSLPTEYAKCPRTLYVGVDEASGFNNASKQVIGMSELLQNLL